MAQTNMPHLNTHHPTIVSPKLGLLIWCSIAVVAIIILLILLLIATSKIYNNTNNTEDYVMKKINIFNSAMNQLSSQYYTNKGDNISDNSYTSQSGTVYYGPKSANSTIGTGAAIQAYTPQSTMASS